MGNYGKEIQNKLEKKGKKQRLAIVIAQ